MCLGEIYVWRVIFQSFFHSADTISFFTMSKWSKSSLIPFPSLVLSSSKHTGSSTHILKNHSPGLMEINLGHPCSPLPGEEGQGFEQCRRLQTDLGWQHQVRTEAGLCCLLPLLQLLSSPAPLPTTTPPSKDKNSSKLESDLRQSCRGSKGKGRLSVLCW